jgi:hypothetical protein
MGLGNDRGPLPPQPTHPARRSLQTHMPDLLPDCMAMVGPSDPCKGYTRLEAERDQLVDYLVKLHTAAVEPAKRLRQQLARNRPTITLTREDAEALLEAVSSGPPHRA